jgi:hypothetical protein
MSVLQTALVFGGIPLAAIALVAAVIYGAAARRRPRYRPDLPFEFAPVWYTAPPARADSAHAGSAPVDAPVATAQGGTHATW